MRRRRKSRRQKIRRIQAYIARTIFLLILLAAVLLIFFGGRSLIRKVSSAFSGPAVSGNSIKISKSGVIKETIYEDFDTEKYSEEELEKMVNDTIAEYNNDSEEKDAVKLSSLKIKNGNAIMVMEYASPEVYTDFNNIPLTISESDDGTKLSLNMDVSVITPSKIKDSSGNVEITDSKVAIVKEGSSDSYIIY
ncbi:MAG: hypothetical protein K5894_04120 [Lachnospiraceae bacterium]|nr:hypothetical protein [Lachnospiraceae bacterium]